jgi:hypothetical protein
MFHIDKTNFKPSFKDTSFLDGSLPALSAKNDLSSVNIWDTLTTDSFDNPDSFFEISKLPGASAKRIFEVTTATMTVLILLLLKSLDEITTTGRL